MPLRGVILNDAPVPWGDVPDHVLAPEIVLSLSSQDRTGLHLTNLTICPYRVARDRKRDIYVPVDVAYRMSRGKAWDALCMEFPRPGALYQRTFTRALGPVDVIGTPDIVDILHGAIEDYKAPSRRMQAENLLYGYVLQLNGYAWLSRPFVEVPIDNLFLNVCGPKGYQQIPVPKMPLHQVEDVLYDRYMDLQAVLEMSEVGCCSDPTCVYCRGVSIAKVPEA